MRQFNAGVNQLPQANALRQPAYSVRCKLKAGEVTSVPYAVYEIDSYDETNFEYVVKRPTSDSIPFAMLLIGAGHAVVAEKRFMASQVTDAIRIAADTGQTVAVGDDMGTQTDSYKLKVDNTGFKAIKYNTTEGLCLVRPFSSSVSGAVFTYIYTGFYNPSVGPFSGTGGYENMYSSWTDLTYPIDITASQMTMYTDASNVTATYTFASDARLTFDLSYYIQLADVDDNVLGTFAFDRPKTTCNVEGGTPLYVTKNISDGVAGIFASTQSYSIGNTTADTTATKFRTRFYVKYIYEATTTSATISAYFGKIALSTSTEIVTFVTPS